MPEYILVLTGSQPAVTSCKPVLFYSQCSGGAMALYPFKNYKFCFPLQHLSKNLKEFFFVACFRTELGDLIITSLACGLQHIKYEFPNLRHMYIMR